MTRFAVALGSNQGDRAGHLRTALEEMGRLGAVRAVSSLYDTEPMGGPEQGRYLNAVAIIETSLTPGELLAGLQAIEAGHDRVRGVRWGPRTLDLDIVATDMGVIEDTGLQVPHPRAAERRFVLDPLVEIWPEAWVGPSQTAIDALSSVGDQDVDRLASRWVSGSPQGRYWALAQILWLAVIAVALFFDGSLPGSGQAAVRVVGGLLAALGIVVIVTEARSLGPALSILPEPVPGAALVETGLYARVRHPIYGGVVLLMMGMSLLLASLAGALSSIGLLLFFLAKTGYEERQLQIAYPGYAAYRRRVRHRLIPYLL